MNRWTNVLNHTKVIVPNDTKILLKKKRKKTLIKKIMKGNARKRSFAIQVKHQAGVANLLIRSYDR